MGHGLGWTQDNKRCICKKCGRRQLQIWSDLFDERAKCKDCKAKMSLSNTIKYCEVCKKEAKYIHKESRRNYLCKNCLETKPEEWIKEEEFEEV